MTEDQSASLLAAMATSLHGERHEKPTVQTVIGQAGELVDDAEHVSVTVRGRRHHYRTVGASSDLASRADGLQYTLDEGPCVSAASDSGAWFRSGDIGEDRRWPQWGPAASQLGLRSMLSVPLLAQAEPFGAINLYSTETGRFVDPDQVDRALLWATHVSSALSSAQVVSGLETAMASRHTIGMAQGIVMERYALDEHQAFQLLYRLSSHGNLKLRDIARDIVDTRQVPSR